MVTPLVYSLSRSFFRRGVRFLALLLLLVFAPVTISGADSGIQLLRYGAWGLSIGPDPFRAKFPAVVFVPPGTIVFDVRAGALKNYLAVLLHYGHWVQIEKTATINGHLVNALTPIDGLVKPPPSDTIMFHASILCLAQTNRILSLGERKCRQLGDDARSTIPVGQGWIYTFTSSSKPGWLNLFVQLDEQTKAQLKERGLSPAEANFEAKRDDLEELEKHGFLTMLDKRYPRFVFEYQTRQPVYIQCGQKTVTEKAVKGSAKLKAEGGLGVEAPLWAKLLTGLKAKLGLSVEAEVSGETGKTWTISVDTTKASRLFYAATMTDTATGKISDVFIDKIFDCRPSPNIGPGSKILSVKFEIEPPDGADVQEYEFTDPTDYLPVPNGLYHHHPRPIFTSVNSVEQYETVLGRIVAKWGV